MAQSELIKSLKIITKKALYQILHGRNLLWIYLIPNKTKPFLKKVIFNFLGPLFKYSHRYEKSYSLKENTSDLIYSDNYTPLIKSEPLSRKPVRLIAFYLPQFHSTKENSSWWGDGFTEWTNVRPARPLFENHYQPHIPIDLGYYNLLDPKVQSRQVELAKLYGIEAFCFYFYWFDGKRLLEKPVKNYLNNKKLNLPFCLCWANENWTKRWDGKDEEILMKQNHSKKDDLAFIKYVSTYFTDKRYFTINKKPLLLVYAPHLLPSAKKTAALWREWCKKNGVGEIYLACTQSLLRIDPREYGFDAAIDFPPNNFSPERLNLQDAPIVYDWKSLEKMSQQHKNEPYKLFPGVCPSWDNTPRRKDKATIFLNSSPELYRQWLSNEIKYTVKNFKNTDERVIFINAWNEWGEGAHLEPDLKYGYSWLQATRDALENKAYNTGNKKIILIAHDAYPHGAQYIILNLAKILRNNMRFEVAMVCLGDGPMKIEYEKYTSLYDLTGKDCKSEEVHLILENLFNNGFKKAIVNTTVSGRICEALSKNNIEFISLIHELSGVIKNYKLTFEAKSISKLSKKIIFPADKVLKSFNQFTTFSKDKTLIHPQGLYKKIDNSLKLRRYELMEKYGLDITKKVVLNVAYGDYRKGIDLFVDIGLEALKMSPNIYFIWVGNYEKSLMTQINKKLIKFPEFKSNFIFTGFLGDICYEYYFCADIFALTSREDPFPSVILEALSANLPVIGFKDTGGFDKLLQSGCGLLIPNEDIYSYSNAIIKLLENTKKQKIMGNLGAKLIKEKFSFYEYAKNLIGHLDFHFKKISVIVPNYNHAKFLKTRIESIINQSYPIYEIIFLDDASTDESLIIAEKILSNCGINYHFVINDKNSGDVFSQWRKGIDLAKGEFIWIAESDDSATHYLLENNIRGFRVKNVALSYSESMQINENDDLINESYNSYTKILDNKEEMSMRIFDGHSFIVDNLYVKNHILNVSAVLFDSKVLKKTLKENLDLITNFKFTGDWFIYLTILLRNHSVAFSPASHNVHRRHSNSFLAATSINDQVKEINKIRKFAHSKIKIPQKIRLEANSYTNRLKKHG